MQNEVKIACPRCKGPLGVGLSTFKCPKCSAGGQDMQKHEKRMRELDAEGVQALFVAAGEYHRKYSSGPGGASVCICGAACGGSLACRGLATIRDLFLYANLDDPEWRQRFETVGQFFDR